MGEKDPQDPVRRAKPEASAIASLQDAKLVAQRQDFEL
jgi:hypothetical protein